MRAIKAVLTAGVLTLGLAACGGGGDDAGAASSSARSTSSAPTTSSAPATTSSAASTSPGQAGSAGSVLDDFIAKAPAYAGPEAWGHTTSARLIGPALLITDWTPATVDEGLANKLCGAAYQWRQESGPYGPAANIRAIALYEAEEQGGKQVFDC